jgi:glycosyltransferase involved in cell wall biosynthesis
VNILSLPGEQLPDYLSNGSEYPRISIVTPNYNQGQFLEATIRSVICQNYPNLEYIVIDGGSSDNSVEIIKKYEKYLSYWCSEPDSGQYDAINKGLSLSTGQIMCWLNSDDIYFPFTLKTVADIMSSLNEIEWLTTLNLADWDWHGFSLGTWRVPGYSKEAFLDGYYCSWLRKNIIQQESTFWRRSLWNKVDNRIRSEFQFAGDFDLWCRFFKHSNLYGTPSLLGGFRHRLNQRCGNIQYGKEAIKALNELRKELSWSPNHLRDLVTNLRLSQIPKMGTALENLIGFSGKRVVRKKAEYPDSYWEIENFKFL